MTLGDHLKVTCPSDTAYGSRGAGGLIPPNSDLIFEIEMLSFGSHKRDLWLKINRKFFINFKIYSEFILGKDLHLNGSFISSFSISLRINFQLISNMKVT